MKNVVIVFFLLISGIFTVDAQKGVKVNSNKQKDIGNLSEIYFAGGCFWGTEHFIKQINGVKSTEVGYANGTIKNPTYKQVSTGNTGFAETVKVTYDPLEVDLDILQRLYFKTIDPTSLNRQGGDHGSQYRTGIYYVDKSDLPIIEVAIKALAKNYQKPIVIEVKPLSNFYPAEDYHQDYLDKNVDGYCYISPDLFEYARKANARPAKTMYQKSDDATFRAKLSDQQYVITQKKCYRTSVSERVLERI